MKLFKISFISIISIFFFHSQLYGINLRCDFKRKVNKTGFNGINCGEKKKYRNFCDDQEGNSRTHRWISEVIIKDKDVEIVRELSDYDIDTQSNKVIRKIRESFKEEKFLVESEVHQKFEFDGRRIDERDRYFFVIQESESTSHPMYHRPFYTLFFDNNFGESILTYYRSHESLFTTSYYGECKIE